MDKFKNHLQIKRHIDSDRFPRNQASAKHSLLILWLFVSFFFNFYFFSAPTDYAFRTLKAKQIVGFHQSLHQPPPIWGLDLHVPCSSPCYDFWGKNFQPISILGKHSTNMGFVGCNTGRDRNFCLQKSPTGLINLFFIFPADMFRLQHDA